MDVKKQPASDGDCLSCRLVSTGGLLGASAYVWYHSRQLKGLGKLAAYSLCGGLCYLGCARFARLPPFLHKWRRDVHPPVPSDYVQCEPTTCPQLLVRLDAARTSSAIHHLGRTSSIDTSSISVYEMVPVHRLSFWPKLRILFGWRKKNIAKIANHWIEYNACCAGKRPSETE